MSVILGHGVEHLWISLRISGSFSNFQSSLVGEVTLSVMVTILCYSVEAILACSIVVACVCICISTC